MHVDYSALVSTSTFMEDIGGKKSKKVGKEHLDSKGQALKQHELREERLNTLGRKVSGIKLFLRIKRDFPCLSLNRQFWFLVII